MILLKVLDRGRRGGGAFLGGGVEGLEGSGGGTCLCRLGEGFFLVNWEGRVEVVRGGGGLGRFEGGGLRLKEGSVGGSL